jgi:hypothetical protein
LAGPVCFGEQFTGEDGKQNTQRNLACFGAQDEIAKSTKAVLIRRIARLVRQEGLVLLAIDQLVKPDKPVAIVSWR